MRLASRSVRGEHNYKAQLSALSLEPLGHAVNNVTLDDDCFNTRPEQQIAHLARCLRLYGFLLVLALARVIPGDRYNCRGTSLQLTASYVTYAHEQVKKVKKKTTSLSLKFASKRFYSLSFYKTIKVNWVERLKKLEKAAKEFLL